MANYCGFTAFIIEYKIAVWKKIARYSTDIIYYLDYVRMERLQEYKNYSEDFFSYDCTYMKAN